MGPNGARWVEIAGQAILHTIVASLFVEALTKAAQAIEGAAAVE